MWRGTHDVRLKPCEVRLKQTSENSETQMGVLNLHKSGNELNLDLHKSGNELMLHINESPKWNSSLHDFYFLLEIKNTTYVKDRKGVHYMKSSERITKHV